MAPFKKYGTCMMTFFIHLCHTLSQFYPITSPVFFTKNNELWNERKNFFLYLWLLQRITAYQRMQKIASSDTIACMYIQPIKTKY